MSVSIEEPPTCGININEQLLRLMLLFGILMSVVMSLSVEGLSHSERLKPYIKLIFFTHKHSFLDYVRGNEVFCEVFVQ